MVDRLDLGLGLVVFPGMLELLDAFDESLGCYEVEPQTLALPRGVGDRAWRAGAVLWDELAARGRPLLAHGVAAPVGGGRFDERGADDFARCARELDAVAATEHLSFQQVGGVEGEPLCTGLFLPPCPNEAGIERAVEAVRAHRVRLDRPFGVETGVSYLQPLPGQLSDSELVAAVAEDADCEVLLDLHNLWCNERNRREPVERALAILPLERVTELHLAGGLELRGRWLDGHCDLVPPELMRILPGVLERLPRVRAVVFELLPLHVRLLGVERLADHLRELAELVDRARSRPVVRAAKRAPRARSSLELEPEHWEASLAAAATGWSVDPRVPPMRDPAVPLLRLLVDCGRAGRVVSGAPACFHLLRAQLRPEALDELMARFVGARRPALYGMEEARSFLTWLADEPPPIAGIEGALAADFHELEMGGRLLGLAGAGVA